MREQPDRSCERLAELLMLALTKAWVKHTPQHDSPDFAAVKHLGRVGYKLVAAELLALGVRPPLEKME